MAKSKIEKFVDFYLSVSTDKIAMLQEYCRNHGIDEPELYVNIAEDDLAGLNKFLDDHDILEHQKEEENESKK